MLMATCKLLVQKNICMYFPILVCLIMRTPQLLCKTSRRHLQGGMTGVYLCGFPGTRVCAAGKTG